MARPTMPLNQFMEELLDKAFDRCGEIFHPVDDERRGRNKNAMLTQLKGSVPKRFLQLLETSEDPLKMVEDALEDIAGTQNEYPLVSKPGKFTREEFLQEIALYTINHICLAAFGPRSEAGLKFTQDIYDIYTFLKQKTEQAMAEDKANGSGNNFDAVQIELREEEKKELIQRHANSLFSVHAFIKKVAKVMQAGQYL